MKNYGLATLTFVVGVALGVIIGLLINGGDDTSAELAAQSAQLRVAEGELTDARVQFDETSSLLEASEAARQAMEAELEQLLDEQSDGQSELLAQLEEAQRQLEELMNQQLTSGLELADVQASVVPHIFILQELGAYAAAGYVGEEFASDPAVLDALDELPSDVALVVRQLFAEPDAVTAGAKYRDVVQRVLNSLQTVVTG
jgi:uncharacterized membrane-anchored protein YhcB (DUF1043 family)